MHQKTSEFKIKLTRNELVRLRRLAAKNRMLPEQFILSLIASDTGKSGLLHVNGGRQ